MPLDVSFVVQSNRLVGELQHELRHAVSGAVHRSGERIKEDARRRVPVDTGKTRDSIDFEVDDQDGRIELIVFADRFGDHPEVPGLLEYGTRYMPARPWMTPAGEGDRETFNGEMRQIVDELGR